MNLTERIYGSFLNNSAMEVKKGTCTKKEYLEKCEVAFGAFQLVVLSDVDVNLAFRLVSRYWDYAREKAESGTPLTGDEVVNTLTLLLLDEFPEHLLGMPEEEFFRLITEVALGNMGKIVEDYFGKYDEEGNDNHE